MVVAASVLMQVCLGGIYAWSEFNEPLSADHGLATWHTQAIFGCVFMMFTVAMIVAGRMQARRGPRTTALISGVLFGAGYLLSSWSGGAFVFLLFGIGILGGAGIGFGYISALSTGIAWFPKHKGLITGISVAGYGGGAIVLSQIVGLLFDAGYDVLDIFQWIGIVYGAIVLLCALFLSVPTVVGKARAISSNRLRVILGQASFWAVVAGIFSGTFAGMMVIGNLKTIGTAAGFDAETATLGIVLFSVGNVAGRIIWGRIYDWAAQPALPAALLFLGVVVLLLAAAPLHESVFLPTCLAVGFGFGSCFVLYASHLAATRGPQAVETVYPWAFLSYGISGILGPVTGGWLYDTTDTYLPAFVLAFFLAMAGMGAMQYLHRRSSSE
jgi:OFA family oxalate/formate antiporter-like MFS transporter